MLDAIKHRRSVRQYQDKDISGKDLEEIIEAATMAPSPLNLQTWKFYIVRDKEKKRQIRSIYNATTKTVNVFKKLHLTTVPVYDQNTSFLEAATLIIPCYDIKTPYARDSLAMAIQNLMIQATCQGIAGLCMGRPTTFNKHKKRIKQLVGIEKGYEVPYIIAVGYPVEAYEEYAIPERKALRDIMVLL